MRRLTQSVLLVIAFAFGSVAVSPASTPVFNGDIITKTTPTFNVLAYGAKGNGTTDDTTAIQAAITAAGAKCGTVLFPVALYYTTGTLTVPQCVTLEGALVGPFDFPIGATPGTVAYAPTFLVTSGSGSSGGTPFITLDGDDVVENLAFYYPNQVAITASTPTAYPWTIQFALSNSQGNIVKRNTFINSYQAIETHAGQSHIEHNMIGAFSQAILVDGSADTTWLESNHITPVWDLIFNGGVAPGSTIDTWVQANQIAIQFLRADSNVLVGNVVFTGNIGIDIGSPGSSHVDSWGNGTANYLEDQNIGIRANTSGNQGWVFANTYIESFHTYSVQTNTPASGDSTPNLQIVGGAMGGYSGASTTPNNNSGIINTIGVSNLAPSNFQALTLGYNNIGVAPTNGMAVGVDVNGYATIRANNGNGVQLQNGSGSQTFLQSNAVQTNIPPSGTATSGLNYGSGDFYLQSSQWNGSAPVTYNSGFFARTDGGVETVVNGTNTGFFGASSFSQKVPIQASALANGTTTQSYVSVVYTNAGAAVASTWHTVSYSCTFSAGTTCAVSLTASTAAPYSSANSYSCAAPDMGTATSYIGYTIGNKSASGFTVYASASNSNTVYGTCQGS